MRWRNTVEMFRDRVARSGGRTALRSKLSGTWRPESWSGWDTAAREVAAGLCALGVADGDRVALLANTRAEWVESDVGILMAGAVTVPIYQSNTARECAYILGDSQAKVAIVEDAVQLAKLTHPEVRDGLVHLAKVVVMSGQADGDWVMTYADLRARGRAWLAEHAGALEQRWAAIGPDHLFTIVYTSGTTGPPKGAVLTHGNMLFECAALDGVLQIGERDEQLLFLPLAHIFAKILVWTAIAQGTITAFAESAQKLVENLKEIRPTYMGAVPRVYEKVYTKLQAGFAEKRKHPVTRVIVDGALEVGRRRSAVLRAGRRLDPVLEVLGRVADKLVFEKVQATFGGRLRFLVSGGAPLARDIAELFHTCGLLVLEGYGLTETTAATHINRPDAFRFGSVGRALPGVDVRIAEDGEILVRGQNILLEYFGKPDATRDAIDPDGWFHTGDIGVVEDGFLRITDRKKDIIVTAGGKNVAPQNIESALKAQCPYVSQVMVHGDKRNYLTALVTLNEETVTVWAKEQGIAYKDLAELAAKPQVRRLIDEAVSRLNRDLASYETIKKFQILPRDLTQEAGELTPTLKVKRKFLSEKYRDLLDGLYRAENP